jgi:NADH-quinone oxidoreductase subunit A
MPFNMWNAQVAAHRGKAPIMVDWGAGIFVAIFACIVLGIIVAMRLANQVLGGYQPNPEKETPFEGGVPPTGDARAPFSVDFYLVAVSFLIFELEAAFLFAWAVAYWELGVRGTIGATVFIIILILGLVYEWRKGALSWGQSHHQQGR